MILPWQAPVPADSPEALSHVLSLVDAATTEAAMQALVQASDEWALRSRAYRLESTINDFTGSEADFGVSSLWSPLPAPRIIEVRAVWDNAEGVWERYSRDALPWIKHFVFIREGKIAVKNIQNPTVLKAELVVYPYVAEGIQPYFLDRFISGVSYGAAAILCSQTMKPWTNAARAAEFYSLFKRFISDSAATAARGSSATPLVAQTRPFL